MPVAIILLTVGGLMVYSALKGVSIADAFRGAVGGTLNPAGEKGFINTGEFGGGEFAPEPADGATPDLPAGSKLNKFGLRGPNAAKLAALATIAETQFNLHVGSVCRSKAHNAAVGGSPTSFHVQCRAFDSTGRVEDRVAFARFAATQVSGIAGAEVFCDQAGMRAPGFDHSDHVHVGA